MIYFVDSKLLFYDLKYISEVILVICCGSVVFAAETLYIKDGHPLGVICPLFELKCLHLSCVCVGMMFFAFFSS